MALKSGCWFALLLRLLQLGTGYGSGSRKVNFNQVQASAGRCFIQAVMMPEKMLPSESWLEIFCHC